MIKRNVAIVEALHVREAGEGQESRTIEGYALKFGVRSRLLCDWWNDYYEVLEPGCLSMEVLNDQDIKLTMFHDRQLILARSNHGAGTLHYEVDEVGVKFWAEMPHTADGDKALELVQRGDIAGCSFCYSTDEEDSMNAVSYERINEKTEKGDDILVRHVKRIDNVYDFTLAADPAYEQTEVSRREVEENMGKSLEAEENPDKQEPTESPEKPGDDEADSKEGEEKPEREAIARRNAKARLIRETRQQIADSSIL